MSLPRSLGKSILVCLLVFALVWLALAKTKNNDVSAIPSVTIDGAQFSIEISNTPSQRETGLMGRKQLAENSGMLFLFPNAAIYPFWNKNTFIPLDVIWINSGKVVFTGSLPAQTIGADTTTLTPTILADRVLELSAGSIEQAKIKIGDSYQEQGIANLPIE